MSFNILCLRACQLLFFLSPCTLWGGPTRLKPVAYALFFFREKFFRPSTPRPACFILIARATGLLSIRDRCLTPDPRTIPTLLTLYGITPIYSGDQGSSLLSELRQLVTTSFTVLIKTNSLDNLTPDYCKQDASSIYNHI